MITIKPVIIRCNNCKSSVKYLPAMESVNHYERDMGAEIEYEGSGEIECPGCTETISIRVSAWEYPQGVLNHSQIKCDGGSVIQEPVIEIKLDD